MVENMVNFAGTFWIGMYKEANSTAFAWSDNSLIDYTHWVKGRPSSPRGPRTCVQANNTVGSVGRWSDVDCSAKKAFICQINKGTLYRESCRLCSSHALLKLSQYQ